MGKYSQFKEIAINLRRKGKTYGDIRKILGMHLPKSTLSLWCALASFSDKELESIALRKEKNIRDGRMKTLMIKQAKRETRFQEIRNRHLYLRERLEEKDVAKISLVMLYLCEGGKSRGSCSFGNSDPRIIQLFLRLMRGCYKIDEDKFRATVQCRADQDTQVLMLYWSEITNIPLRRFYPPQIDKRTVGKPTRKAAYKGVCKIDYFSAATYNELRIIGSLF